MIGMCEVVCVHPAYFMCLDNSVAIGARLSCVGGLNVRANSVCVCVPHFVYESRNRAKLWGFSA